MKNFGIFLVLFVLAFSSCRKDIDETTTIIETLTPPILENYTPTYIQANGDLRGFVFDETGEPIEGAKVTLINSTTFTDQFGHFFFANTNMNAVGTLVQIEKEGYFLGSRRFHAIEDAENRVQIELIVKNFSQNFESTSGGTINLNGGGTVVFTANSIQNEDGTVYTGEVKVASHWLDPSDYSTFTKMPGNLFGVDNSGEEVVLGTMGMIAVELESASGEPLNILEGKTAKVTTPIPASLLANAPNEIPLWSYNEEYGVWVEEGVSMLENGNYVAEVTHFSYWNHDFKDPLINFTALFTNEDGVPLENYQVVVRLPGTSLFGTGHTCDQGLIAGLIPKDAILELEILGLCNEVLYTIEVGPFSEDTDLGTIMIPESVLGSTTVTGELVDCDGNSIQNGVVVINFSNGTVYEYVNGESFEVIFSSCSSSDQFEAIGYNTDALIQSEVELGTPNEVNNLGDIEVCDIALENYISISVDGNTPFIYLNANADKDTVGVTYIAHNEAQSTIVYIEFPGITVGSYDNMSLNYFTYLDNANGISALEDYLTNITITEYGDVGEPIIGTFSGTVENTNNGSTIDLVGEFSVIRQN